MSKSQIQSIIESSIEVKQALLNEGFSVTEANFIKTENSDFDFPSSGGVSEGRGSSIINDNLIFTSQNAAQSVLLHPKCQELKAKNEDVKIMVIGDFNDDPTNNSVMQLVERQDLLKLH